MGDWRPALSRLVQRTDPSTINAFSVKTSVPVAPWKTRNVALLGDALHNMPPFHRVGANLALWDAAALCGVLVAADRGEEDLLTALGNYERAMIDHGFQAVRASLKDMARFHAEGRLERTSTKGLFRAVDLIPGIRTVVWKVDRRMLVNRCRLSFWRMACRRCMAIRSPWIGSQARRDASDRAVRRRRQ
jgi:2-polyprenyl-6-methoxyphenol hydroxylase-like FAD-dependent oxidoreductase